MPLMSKPRSAQRRTPARVATRPSYPPTARDVARQAAYCARGWAAPRLERTGRSLEEQVAPKISAVLCRAARRVEPPRPESRRRWPVAAAGLVLAGGTVAVVAWRRRQRRRASLPETAREREAAYGQETGQAAGQQAPAPAAHNGVNGRVPVA
jgi:hypothetical protein